VTKVIIKPNLRAIKIFVRFITLLGAYFVSWGIFFNEIVLTIIGILFIIYFPAVRCCVRIIIDDDHIEYQGIFKNFNLKWKEIKKIHVMYKYGYPTDRIFGPLVYELQTSNSNKNNSKKINFLYFAGNTFHEIEKRIKNKS